MAIIGAPQVTPVALQNALLEARRRGPINDPYGLIASMKSVGDSYNNMNTGLIHANQLARDQAQTNARLESGYYPAEAQANVALNRTNEAVNQDKLAHLQDLQRAVKETMAEGIQRGDPRFMVSVQGKLQNYSAMKAVQPEVDKSVNQMQVQHMQRAYVEQQVPRNMALQQAANAYPAVADAYAKTLGLTSLPPNSAESKLVWKRVIKEAVDHVKSLGLKASIDPIKGIVTLVDNTGQTQEVPWQEVGKVMRIGGDPQLDALYNSMFQQSRQRAQTDTATALGASRAGLSDAQAAGVGGRNVRGLGRVSDDGIKHLSDSLRAKRDIIKADPNMSTAEKLKEIDKIDAALQNLHVDKPLTMEVDPAIAAGRARINPGPADDYGSRMGRVPGVDYAAPGILEIDQNRTPAINISPYANIPEADVPPYGVKFVPGTASYYDPYNNTNYNPQRAQQAVANMRQGLNTLDAGTLSTLQGTGNALGSLDAWTAKMLGLTP